MPSNSKQDFRVTEYLRPWKLTLLGVGVVLLISGARLSGLPDWNIAISLIMALATYLSAPVVVRIVMQRNWALMPLALLAAWGVIYGCYIGYWRFADPSLAGFIPNIVLLDVAALYVCAGLIWCYHGSFSSLREQATQIMRRQA